jgi:hypothetical protein
VVAQDAQLFARDKFRDRESTQATGEMEHESANGNHNRLLVNGMPKRNA